MAKTTDYYDIGMSCIHCGKPLSARHVTRMGGISIAGLRPLEYRHTENGERDCYIRREATPYDGWRASAAYDKARDAELEREDS